MQKAKLIKLTVEQYVYVREDSITKSILDGEGWMEWCRGARPKVELINVTPYHFDTDLGDGKYEEYRTVENVFLPKNSKLESITISREIKETLPKTIIEEIK